MSTIPQRYFHFSIFILRPPDTPLNSFFMTGKYDKEIKYEQFKKNQAMPVRS